MNEKEIVLQVVLFQNDSFFHRLTQNMTTRFVLGFYTIVPELNPEFQKSYLDLRPNMLSLVFVILWVY